MLTAALDWSAVLLPTLLAIAGVFVSVENPLLPSLRAQWAARAGLLAIGLLVSVTIAVQQNHSRNETAEIKRMLATIADAVKVDRNGSAQSLAAEILKKLPSAEWRLTDAQKQKLGEILDSAPEQSRFSIDVRALTGSAQSQMYKDDLAHVFHDHHWQVAGGDDAGMRSDLVGLYIALSPEVKTEQDVPPNARILARIFEQSNIPFKVGTRQGIVKNVFQLDVGTQPAQ
jgi:hypothetical protein